MAAPNIIQNTSTTGSSASLLQFTLNDVTPGSTLVLLLVNSNSGTRTYTVSDNVDGSWSSGIYYNPLRAAGIWYLENSTGGDVTLSITQSGSHVQYFAIMYEIEPSSSGVSGSDLAGADTGTHYCAPSGSLDTAANSIIFSGGVLNASGGTNTKNASATLISTDTQRLTQYRRSDSALTDERSSWTSSTNRTHTCVSMSFVSSADTTAPTVSSATINTAGTQLTIVFDENVTGDGTGFSVDIGSSITATYVSGNGTSTWVFSLSNIVLDADTPTLDYDSGTGDIADLSSNVLATIVNGAVTNNSTQVADVTAPTLSSISLSAPTSLVLVFDESVTLTDETGMTLSASSGAITISAISGDGTNTLTATLSRSVASTESLSFSYNSGTGDVEDLSGNALVTISNLLVTNNVSSSGGIASYGIKTGGQL